MGSDLENLLQSSGTPMIKISMDWNPVYKIIYTECTNMFKHDDMAVIVIRGSSP